MSRLVFVCLITTLTLTGCGGGPPPAPVVPESPLPYATWKVATATGGRIPAGVAANATVTISKEEFTVGDKKFDVTRLIPMKTPPWIDIRFDDDAWQGVYEIAGDDLWISFNAPGQPRPEAAKGKPANCVLTLKRQ